MAEPHRMPKLGDIVLYHQTIRQDIWENPALITWPAIVTEILPHRTEEAIPRLRLTAFRPFDKPLWDIEACFAEQPTHGSWSWKTDGE